MAAVVPDPKSIRAFKSAEAFESWLRKNHQRASEIYLRIYKKDAGMATVTHQEALDICLCWGWIDGIRKSYDAQSFLQRFTPRRPKSIWSQINREKVERLIAERRMTAHGLRHVEAAKADGRWDAAYASGKNMVTPPDLLAAIRANPAAHATYERLDKQNLFALGFRLASLKTAAGRAKKIETFVSMLAEGRAPHPIKPKL